MCGELDVCYHINLYICFKGDIGDFLSSTCGNKKADIDSQMKGNLEYKPAKNFHDSHYIANEG